jgi:hypothetical protein
VFFNYNGFNNAFDTIATSSLPKCGPIERLKIEDAIFSKIGIEPEFNPMLLYALDKCGGTG